MICGQEVDVARHLSGARLVHKTRQERRGSDERGESQR